MEFYPGLLLHILIRFPTSASLAEILARMPSLLTAEGGQEEQFQLVQEAAQGKADRVMEILQRQPHIVSPLTS